MSLRVSVVIPVHDRAGLVGDAVASAFGQEPRPCEIVVVDDGSSDGSAAAAAAAPGSPTVIRHEVSRGPSAARNAGITAASGEWVAFLDSDDVWLPGGLASRARAAEATAGVVLVSADAEAWDGRHIVRPRMLGDVPHRVEDLPLPRLLRGNFVLTSTALVRRDAVLRAGGFPEHLRRCEDYDLWLRVAREGRFAYVDEVVARYRVGPEGLSADPERMLEAEVQVLREAIAGPRRRLTPAESSFARDRIARLWLEAAYRDLVGHRAGSARPKALRAFAAGGARSRALLYLAASFLPRSAVKRIRGARGRATEVP